MRRALLLAALSVLAGCAALPPSPEDVQAKRFETVPGKAVIYIVRDSVDSSASDSIVLDEHDVITTHPQTYYRWEVTPGMHRIRGYVQSSGSVSVQVEAGELYFVQHVVFGTQRAGVLSTHLQRIDPNFGRELVRRARLL